MPVIFKAGIRARGGCAASLGYSARCSPTWAFDQGDRIVLAASVDVQSLWKIQIGKALLRSPIFHSKLKSSASSDFLLKK